MFADQYTLRHEAHRRHNDLLREARAERLAAAAGANDVDVEQVRHARGHGVALRLARLLGTAQLRPVGSH